MLGTRPPNVRSPVLSNAQRLTIANSPNISIQFCNYPPGEYIVETVNNYKVVVKKPDTIGIKAKLTGCENQSDFTVWVFESNNNYWMPKHLETLRAFYNLTISDKQRLFEAIKDVVLNYEEPVKSWELHNCQNISLQTYPSLLVLSYLKWMAVLEDTIYPTNKYLGRKMAFAGYVLINSGLYSPNEIRRLLRIW